MSTTKQHLLVVGLATDPSELVAPEGALAEADNVVVRRAGMAEPRPGFGFGFDTPLDTLRALIPFEGDVLHVGHTSTLDFNSYWPGAEQGMQDGEGNHLQWLDNAIRGCEARGNLYLTTADGVRRATSSGAADALRVGLLPPWIFSATHGEADGDAVLDETCVAYRAVLFVTLEDGLLLFSAPSGRVVYRNRSGTTRNVEVVAGFRPPGIPNAKVELKLYRSEGNTDVFGVPSDDMALVRAFDRTSGSGTAETLIDDVADASRGEALYTNDDQQGTERQNVRPPACKDLALFGGSLFFANLTRQARQVLSWQERPDLTGEDTGVGNRTVFGSLENGSNQITGLSAPTGLRVGQIYFDATDWVGPDTPVVIIAIAGDVATMSHTWGGVTDNVPMQFHDAVYIAPAGAPFDPVYAYRSDEVRWLIRGVNDPSDTGVSNMQQSAIAFAQGVSDVATYEDTIYDANTDGAQSVLIEALSAATTLSLSATHGASYSPALSEVAGAITGGTFDDGLTEPEHIPNGIAWSKTEQPEHAMRGALENIGHAVSEILRIKATRGGIFIFKERGDDGIYKLSGFSESNGWRVDKLDTDTYLLNAELLTALDDVVYAWSSKGVVAVSDAGSSPLSKNLIGSETRVQESQILKSWIGGLAASNTKDGEVIFGLPDGTGRASPPYVFNVRRGAITRWFRYEDRPLSCATYAEGLLMFGYGTQGWTLRERAPDAPVVNADLSALPLIEAISGNVITLAEPFEGWTPAVGDLLVKSDTYYTLITAVTSPTVFEVEDATGFTVGVATAYMAFESVIAWLGRLGEGPGVLKKYRELITHWDETLGVGDWTLGLESSRNLGTVVPLRYEREWVRTSARELRDDHRALVPISVALAARLYPSLRVRQADSRWRIAGLTMVSEPVSMRVSV